MPNFCYGDFEQGDLLVRKWAPNSEYQITTWLFLKIRRTQYNEGRSMHDKMELDTLCSMGPDEPTLMTMRYYPYEAVVASNSRTDFAVIRNGVIIWPATQDTQ